MSLARNTAVTSALSLLAVGTGVALDGVIVATFGLGNETDGYFIASLIPLLLITILHLHGSKVFQPLFLKVRSSKGPVAAERFVNVSATALTGGALALAAVGIAAAPLLVSIQAPGAGVGTRVQAIQLSAILFFLPALYVPIVLMREVLIASGHFILPGLLKSIDNITKMLFVVGLVSSWGIMVVAVGALVGACIQLMLLRYVVATRHGIALMPTVSLSDASFMLAFRSSGYPLVGQAASIGTDVLQTALGSFAGEGGVTALRLSTRIIDAFAGVLANSVVIALMPAMARGLVEKGVGEMKVKLREGLQLLMILSLPAAAWLAASSTSLVAVLFERMEFRASDTALVASLICAMVPYIFLSRVFSIGELGFYASGDTGTPLVAALFLAASYAILMVLASDVSGLHGIAWSRSIAYLGGAALMFGLLRWRTGPLGLSPLWRLWVQLSLAVATMYVCMRAATLVVQQFWASEFVALSASSAVGVFVFCTIGALLRVGGARDSHDPPDRPGDSIGLSGGAVLRVPQTDESPS